MALEEFLKQTRAAWAEYNVDLAEYQKKTCLIKGWDDLFTTCRERLSSMAQMKASPYFKVFAEEAGGWDDKLNRMNSMFDIWMDVQRRWVYLEGIFTGSADIKMLLPTETERFQGYVSLVSVVLKSGRVM